MPQALVHRHRHASMLLNARYPESNIQQGRVFGSPSVVPPWVLLHGEKPYLTVTGEKVT